MLSKCCDLQLTGNLIKTVSTYCVPLNFLVLLTSPNLLFFCYYRDHTWEHHSFGHWAWNLVLWPSLPPPFFTGTTPLMLTLPSLYDRPLPNPWHLIRRPLCYTSNSPTCPYPHILPIHSTHTHHVNFPKAVSYCLNKVLSCTSFCTPNTTLLYNVNTQICRINLISLHRNPHWLHDGRIALRVPYCILTIVLWMSNKGKG